MTKIIVEEFIKQFIVDELGLGLDQLVSTRL